MESFNSPQRYRQMKTVQQLSARRDLTLEDRADIIRRFELAHHSARHSSRISHAMQFVLDFRRRRFVYRAGDPADCLYAIIHGGLSFVASRAIPLEIAVIDILQKTRIWGISTLFRLQRRANSRNRLRKFHGSARSVWGVQTGDG